MSWLSNILRALGFKSKPKDRAVPNPLHGSSRIQTVDDGSERAKEAIDAIRGYVRAPYQITDRLLTIETVSWDGGKDYFTRYGYNAKNWTKQREGNFYPPKPGVQADGLIHLVSKSLDQNRRVFLAVHEYSHCFYHWILTDAEWRELGAMNWSYEEFADDMTRRLMGDKLSGDKSAFFDRLEKRLTDGTHSIRL